MRNKTVLFSSLFLAQHLTAGTITLSSEQQTDLSLTLYSSNLALVQDSRILGAIDAKDEIVVTDISKQMHPQSLQIAKAGKIISQTLNRDIINYQGLINQHIGKEIILVKEGTNTEEIRQSVKLLNVTNNTAIVALSGNIETIPLQSNKWRFVFPNSTQNLRLKPSLTFKSEGKSTTNNIRLSYLTNGLEWRMDYVLVLNEARDKLNFKGLASLFNNTNTLFNNAKIKLLAGDIAKPRQQQQFNLDAQAPAMLMAKSAARENAPSDIGDLKLYKLPNRATLQPHQQTQIPLLQAEQVAVKTSYRYQFYVNPYIENRETKASPSTYLNIDNQKQNKLGISLPKGQARVYTPDDNGELQFIGASQLRQSNEGDKIELMTGKAFDISIKQRQTNYEKTFDGALVDMQLIISNHSKNEKTLDLSASFNNNWEIISNTYPPSKKSSANVEWKIKLHANSSNVFNLKTRIKTRK